MAELTVGDLVVSLIPYGLAAAAAAPAAAVFSALVLSQAKRPILAGWCFVAGAAVLDAVFATIVLWALEASGEFDGTSDIGAWVDVALGGLFVLLGLFTVFSKETPEKDQKRRARATKLASSGLVGLLGVGMVVQIINSDSLAVFAGGLKEIAIDDVSIGETVIATAFLMAVMLTVYFIPVVMYAISPDRAAPLLRAFSEWLLAHSRPVEIVTGLVLGGIFLVKGISALN